MRYIVVAILFSPLTVLAQPRSSAAQLGVPGRNGKIKALTTYVYRNEQSFKEKKPAMVETEFFDNSGRRIERALVSDDKKKSKTIYHYRKFRVLDTTYKNGEVAETEIEILDGMGRMVERDAKLYNPIMPPEFREIKFKTILQYDKNGNPIGETTGMSGKKPQSKTSYVYDSRNRLIEQDVLVYRSAQNQMLKTVNSYNSSDLKIKHELYENDKLASSSSIQYDDFDKHGNWRLSTEKTEYHSDRIYKDSTITSTTIREITYFK